MIMVKNYWLKQAFFIILFLFCELMIALALFSAGSYLGLIMWCLHPFPLFFVIFNLRNKIKSDIMNFANLGLSTITEKIEDIIKPEEESEVEN